jgi:hypothetical protein
MSKPTRIERVLFAALAVVYLALIVGTGVVSSVSGNWVPFVIAAGLGGISFLQCVAAAVDR